MTSSVQPLATTEWAPFQPAPMDLATQMGGVAAAESLERPLGEREQVNAPSIEEVRKAIAGYHDLQKDKLDLYLKTLYGGKLPPGISRHGRPSDWLEEADDATVRTVLDMHLHWLNEQRQDPALRKAFDAKKQAYADGVQKGMQERWISPQAAPTIERIRRATMRIGDIWETRLQWVVGRYTGYKNQLTFAQAIGADAFEELAATISHTLPHEASHVFGRWMARWGVEGFAEHLGLVVEHGKPTVINPEDRRNEEDSIFYKGERELWATLLTDAPNANAQELALEWLRACTSQSEDSSEWQQFMQSLDNAWGTKGVYRKITDYLVDQERRIEVEHPDWIEWQVQPEALARAKRDIVERPRRIFGRLYRKPRRHVGAAALTGTRR